MKKITAKAASKYMTIDEYEEQRKIFNPTLFERIKNVFSKPKFKKYEDENEQIEEDLVSVICEDDKYKVRKYFKMLRGE